MSEAPSEGRARADSAEVAFRKIFIGGLSFSTDEDKLRKYFKQFGTVQDAVVMKDPVSKRSRGFGFVTYTDITGVDCALSGDAHTIDSRKVEVKRAVPRSEMSRDQNPGNGSQKSAPVTPNGSSSQASTIKSSNNSSSTNNNNSTTTATTKSTTSSTGSAVPVTTASNTGSGSSQSDSTKHGSSDARINLEDYAYNKIFVGGLHYDTRDAEFRTYFEKYGRVISAEVMFNRETHKSRGFGFIVFDNEQSAINVCDGKEHSIDGKVVEVKRAIPRSRLPAGTPTSSITPSMYKAALAPLPMPTTTTCSATTGRSGSGGSSKPRPAQSSVSAGTANTTTAAVAAPHAPITSSRTVSSTSYAAALKGGTAQKSAATTTAKNITVPPPPPATPTATTTTTTGVSRDHTAAAPHLSNSGMNFQSLMYSSGLGSVQRPARSYSEPIVKFEGSFEGCSALNGDILPGGMNRNAGAGAIIKTPSSSRSNSIVQTPGGSLLNNDYSENGGGNNTSVSLGNLPWLSSPPTNSLDAAGVDFGLSLPPTTEQKSLTTGSENAPAGLSAGPPGISNPWFPNVQTTTGLNDTKSQQPQTQQQSQQQQSSFQQQSPFMGGPFGGMMYMPGPFMGVPPPPGVAPSPEHWAAMVSSHAMHEQQQQMGMGPPPGQFPGQPYMMQQYPFFPPDGVFGPGTTPQQQQMMFFNAQQQMQANFQQMQQLQYQNQQQALALAAAQAQMQAAMGNSNSSTNQKGDSQAGNSGSEQQKTLTAAGSNTFPSTSTTTVANDVSNNSTTGVIAAVTGTVKANESSESDDLFQFHELNLNSPAFEPNAAQSWMPAANRR